MNDSGEIRTHDRPLRRRMLYPAELPNHRNVIYYTTWKRKMSNKIYEKIVKTFSLLKEHVNSSWNQLWTFNKKYTTIKAFKDYSGEISRRTNRLALNASIEAASTGEAGKGFLVVVSEGRTKLKRNAWNWRDSGAGNDKSRTHFVLNGRKCCRDVRSFCKFRRGHGNDELVQRKYFRTEEKYRSFQDLIKFFQHSAFCRVFLL